MEFAQIIAASDEKAPRASLRDGKQKQGTAPITQATGEGANLGKVPINPVGNDRAHPIHSNGAVPQLLGLIIQRGLAEPTHVTAKRFGFILEARDRRNEIIGSNRKCKAC